MLIDNEITCLPVDVVKICAANGITLFSYDEGRSVIENLDLDENVMDNDAFSIGSMIFYDSSKPLQRRRFSIAHEIGHIFLHTVSDKMPTVYNREPSPNDTPIETEANIFASRLLAPLCVLQYLNLNSAREISEYCDISYTAAQLRFNRLCEIRKRNSERRKEKKHGTFLLSKLERRVIENFKDYIENNKIKRNE